jgi:hypothetical protein
MAHEPEERGGVVWVSSFGVAGEPRLALSECPVSFVGGESLSFVEDFLAYAAAGGGGDPVDWHARRVDAFAVLHAEMKRLEWEEHGER